ncbi:hypothetical protein CAOG_03183 [Capsaspora owczarzaki ATCC 30864]|uniref:Uncharacterized protein n=1 Tax=Capsaspora owczarzaki (strain ATCC 30864) TaxID=595528 RepID=A0A0D2X294_CAPO3|nr:hypothetical protein CAOG_03183 [Capsaspora owczarzaki ATCC 30864]KJE92164.1 hypothetical protein CAOG_003183 [Capsaspora owczarzaki ATCC 30864]|eukprot:XP_004364022.1 hypothetical protein CAOG_03183 [Capsaspora owczarzaki ATCC 30864]
MSVLTRFSSTLGSRAAIAGTQTALRRFAATHAAYAPNPERQIGDYPDFAPSSAQLKDPSLYEDAQERRNLKDTLHENDELYTVWVVDEKSPVSRSTALKHLLIMAGLLTGLYGLAKLYDAPSRKPTTQRELPFHEPNGFAKQQ